MTDQHENMVKTRKCMECGDEGMMPDSRTFTGMETTIIYQCPSCEATVEFKSKGQAGLMVTVNVLVWAVVTSITVIVGRSWDLFDYILYAGFILLVLYVPVTYLLPYWICPVTGEKPIKKDNVNFEDEEFIKDFKDPVQRGIITLEKFGFLGGLLAPIIFIALFLGAAMLIGMVNFYYF